MQARNQERQIEQRNRGKSFKSFESSGNDIITGDVGLDI